MKQKENHKKREVCSCTQPTKANKPEAAVIGTFVCANNMLKTIFRTAIVTTTVREQGSRTPHAKETVRNEHGPFFSLVPVEPYHLSAHHHCIVIGVRLKNIPCQVHGYDPSTATHPSEVVAEYVAPHLVVVYDHC